MSTDMINPPIVAKQNVLTASTQSREIAEIQSAMMLAKAYPRDTVAAMDKILTDCQRKGLAETAVYSYSKGGTDIEGPSIRLAEAIARQWGNLQYGVRELEQRKGESTVEAFCIDLETNVRSVKVFQVMHKRDTKNGSYPVTDQREIYELVANQGARRLRSSILAVVPGDVVDAAVEECSKTLAAKCDTSPEAVKKMVEAFEKLHVTKEQIETRIQRKIDAITAAQIVALRKVYNSIKDGMSTPADWFATTEKPKTRKAPSLLEEPEGQANTEQDS